MYNSSTDYIIQVQKISTVTNQSKKSAVFTFMPKTTTTSVPSLSKPPSTLLKKAGFYAFSSTNMKKFQSNTKINATANPSQTFHETHFAQNTDHFTPS